MAPIASAHTVLVAASPEPGTTVGGNVTNLSLQFDQGIVAIERFTVEMRGGEEVTGALDQPDPHVLVYELDQSLTEPGEYIVRYLVRSNDGDLNDFGYGFTYAPDADPPPRIAVNSGEGADSSRWKDPLTLIVAGLGALAALVLANDARKSRHGTGRSCSKGPR